MTLTLKWQFESILLVRNFLHIYLVTSSCGCKARGMEILRNLMKMVRLETKNALLFLIQQVGKTR